MVLKFIVELHLTTIEYIKYRNMSPVIHMTRVSVEWRHGSGTVYRANLMLVVFHLRTFLEKSRLSRSDGPL